MNKIDPKAAGADCAGCPFYLNGKHKPIGGTFPAKALGVLVIEGPSQDDENVGRLLTGNTARELENSLQMAGLDRKDLAIVSATCCKPTPDSGTDVRVHAARCCKPMLDLQLRGLEHLPKLLMGTAAVVPFTKVVKGGVEVMRGFYRSEINAIVTHPPAYSFFRNPYSWGAFNADVQHFAQVVGGTLPGDDLVLNLDPVAGDLGGVVERGGGLISVDIETAPESDDKPWTGKDPTRAVLRSISFGTETEAVAFMWEERPDLHAEVKGILENEAVVKVGQNTFWFDDRVLRRYGINAINWEDTRDLRCALSTTSDLSLRFMGSLHAWELGPWKEMEANEGDDSK